MNQFSKNDRQIHFNQVKGIITELNCADLYCSITLGVGHENKRMVNLVMKRDIYDTVSKEFKVGDRACARFYVSSRFKNGRWYTMCNCLAVFHDKEKDEE